MVTAYSYAGGLALDAAGSVYITGTTRSADFPTTPGAFDTDYNDDDAGAVGGDDGFYVKLSSTGALAYGTYLGGRRADEPHGIDVDAAGNVYVVGSTGSDETLGADGGFVIAGGSYDPTYNGAGDLFLLRFNAAGALTYSTYLGGTSGDGNIATNVRASRTAANVVYVVGDSASASFPTTASRVETYDGSGAPDAVLVRLNLALAGTNQLTYGTFLGGSGDEVFASLALDASDKVYVAGHTISSAATFPAALTVAGSIAPSGTDVLVAKFDTTLSGAASLVFATRINGFYTDVGRRHRARLGQPAVDRRGKWLVRADAECGAGLPARQHAADTAIGQRGHHAVVQLNAAGNGLLLSSLIGGNAGSGGPSALAITAGNEVWVGATSAGGTSQLALTTPFQANYGGGDADATLQRIGLQADLTLDQDGRQAGAAVHGASGRDPDVHDRRQQRDRRHRQERRRHRQPAGRGRVRFLCHDSRRRVWRRRQQPHRSPFRRSPQGAAGDDHDRHDRRAKCRSRTGVDQYRQR